VHAWDAEYGVDTVCDQKFDEILSDGARHSSLIERFVGKGVRIALRENYARQAPVMQEVPGYNNEKGYRK
jgi:hypothetical protein